MRTIASAFRQLGSSAGALGAPLGVEQLSANGAGRFRLFHNGAIYWRPGLGAFAVQGEIYHEWVRLGGEGGILGYPTSDQRLSGDGLARCACFQKGRIYCSPGGRIYHTDLSSDAAVVGWAIFRARPLRPGWANCFVEFGGLPSRIDYEAEVNFARNQGTKLGYGFGGDGCSTYALLHIADILKDWEHPYTPALSYRYAHWFNLDFKEQHGRNPSLQEQAANGYASEGLCPTNFDSAYWETTDSQGEVIAHWQEPCQAAKDEAALYRVEMPAEVNYRLCIGDSPEQVLEAIKQTLRAYGPLWCGGCDHAKVIVGYEDDEQRFKILDSIPHEESGGHHITYINYQDVGLGKAIEAFAEVTNIFSEARLAGRYAYSARIAIDGNWRGTYNVRLGVEGREPLTVWTTRGRDVDGYDTPLEHGRFLRIDVPLPEYAAEC